MRHPDNIWFEGVNWDVAPDVAAPQNTCKPNDNDGKHRRASQMTCSDDESRRKRLGRDGEGAGHDDAAHAQDTWLCTAVDVRSTRLDLHTQWMMDRDLEKALWVPGGSTTSMMDWRPNGCPRSWIRTSEAPTRDRMTTRGCRTPDRIRRSRDKPEPSLIIRGVSRRSARCGNASEVAGNVQGDARRRWKVEG